MDKMRLSSELLREYTKIAYYYFKEGLTQEAIAKCMHMSRQRVNRIIQDCIEYGIVKISITDLNNYHIETETALEKKYGLKTVRITDSLLSENIAIDLGKEAGRYLESIIKDNDIIGFSRGKCTSALVDQMPSIKRDNITVTQLLGNENRDSPRIEVNDIVYRFSEKLNAQPALLYAPVIVGNKKAKQSIVSEDFFIKAYKTICSCTIAVVGIASAQQWKDVAGLYANDGTDNSEWTEKVQGEVATHFFDFEGKSVRPPFHDRIISIDLDDFLRIPTRIGIAGGAQKIQAIRAALKGGYVNVLITDADTAAAL